MRKTAVGDKYVYEKHASKINYSLGGEQSGHIIFSKYATTGGTEFLPLLLFDGSCHGEKNSPRETCGGSEDLSAASEKCQSGR